MSIEKAPSEPDGPRGAEGEHGRSPVTGRQRSSLVVRPGVFLTLVILSAFGAGYVIYRLLRGMHI